MSDSCIGLWALRCKGLLAPDCWGPGGGGLHPILRGGGGALEKGHQTCAGHTTGGGKPVSCGLVGPCRLQDALYKGSRPQPSEPFAVRKSGGKGGLETLHGIRGHRRRPRGAAVSASPTHTPFVEHCRPHI